MMDLMKNSNDIEGLRKKIDELDDAILKLISERGELAKGIGSLKRKEGDMIYVPSREKQIFDRLSHVNDGPYNVTAVHAIFREIISATRALEQPIRVAFLGPTATFTHKAAVEHFGNSASFTAQVDIASVFYDVEAGHADFGVVPIENSTEGIVNYTLDKFMESELKICSEIIISVEHHLMSAESEIKNIMKVYSHPQALAQCRQWLSLHVPQASLNQMESTAAAARTVVNEKGAAAVASGFAADMYGLNILAHGIQDQRRNFTRFLVIGKRPADKTGRDKTSIAFVSKDEPGILYKLLKPLAEAKVNLTKIESRPLKTKAWEYMFFIDMDGHASQKKIALALEKLKKGCVSFKILGSYPRAAGSDS